MLRIIIFAVAFCFGASEGGAQEHRHPPEHAALHDLYYQNWARPDNRAMSCCNKQDCAPVEHVRRFNGQLQMQRAIDGAWITIPAEKLENNVEDARDSPDGRSHMCSNGEYVFCAVLGNGM